MKRTLTVSETQTSKRRKSRQACVSCRKHKTRCETLDFEVNSSRCHRCKVLALSCSFEELNIHHSLTSTDGGDPYSSTAGDRTAQGPSSAHPPGPLSPEGLLGWSGTLTPESLLAPRLPEDDALDWFDAPMLAMQELLRKDPQEVAVPPASNISDILSQAEIESLLALFDSRFSPWLHFSTDYLRRHPFLDLTKCTVAARYLELTRRSSVIPRLSNLVDAYTFKFAFTSVQSMETVTALLILSLWPPAPNSIDAPAHDSRMIASSAVSAAIQLSLNQAVPNAVKLVSSNDAVSDADKEVAVNKVRLWLSLLSAEWMLCMGTSRTPTSQRSDLDYQVFDTVSPSSLNTSSRDLRLYFLTRIQSLAGKGLQIHLQDGPRALQTFHDEIVENVLIQLEIVYTSIQPLGVTVDFESYHFNMLVIQHHSCRLLVLYHILSELRRYDARTGQGQPEGPRTWYSGLKRTHDTAVREWGLDCLTTAQSLLVTFLSHPGPDREFLSTAPDSVFSIILMAAALVVLGKTSVLRYYKGAEKVVLIASEELMPKVIARLNRIADISESAHKCAEVIGVLLRTWKAEARVRSSGLLQWQPSAIASPEDTPGASSSSSDFSTAQHQHHGMPDLQTGQHHNSNNYDFENVFSHPVNQEMFLDVEFWNTFAQSTVENNLSR